MRKIDAAQFRQTSCDCARNSTARKRGSPASRVRFAADREICTAINKAEYAALIRRSHERESCKPRVRKRIPCLRCAGPAAEIQSGIPCFGLHRDAKIAHVSARFAGTGSVSRTSSH